MVYSYKECYEHCIVQIKRYTTFRKQEDLDVWEVQNIRDELSEALLFFGPTYSRLRTVAEQTEVDRKLHYEERKEHWKTYFKGERGTASMVESKALRDCKNEFIAENKAKGEYYDARTLVERVDQVLNSIASRVKLMDKYEQN